MDVNTKKFTLDALLPTDAKAFTVQEDGDVLIEGYASDIGVDRMGDVVAPGAFEEAIKSFLETNPVLLYNHDINQPLGVVQELESRPEGLFMKALVSRPLTDTAWNAPIVDSIKRGFTKGLSVRGRMERPYGRNAKSGHALVTKADLAEISITPLPVHPRTMFTMVTKAFGDEGDALSSEQAASVRAHFEERIAETEAAIARLQEATTKTGHVEAAKDDLRGQLSAIHGALAAANAARATSDGLAY